MRISRFLPASMTCGAVVAFTATSWAQEAAPVAPAAPAPEAAPAEPTPAAPEAAAPEAAAEAPAEAPAEEEDAGPSSWFRIDSDFLGLQLWAGTISKIGSLDIATDIYVGTGGFGGNFGEFDIGPTFSVADGKLILTPMIGVSFDWTAREFASIVPQFYTIYNGDLLYFESWIQVFLNSPSDYLGGPDYLYSRDFLLIKATDDFRIGPGIEFNVGLNAAGKLGGDAVYSMPIGGVINYNAMGDWKGTIGIFLGVDTKDNLDPALDPTAVPPATSTSDKIMGRMTYIHYF